MLVIRRRRGESVVVGEDIEIEILEVTPTQVKLGIRAPKEVTVLRSEIRTTRDVNRVSTQTTPDEMRLSNLAESLREIAKAAGGLASTEPTVRLPQSTNVK